MIVYDQGSVEVISIKYIMSLRINREPKVWVCIDDGTQRNFFYANNHGEKSRREPAEFQYEELENGERKFYFRGNVLPL